MSATSRREWFVSFFSLTLVLFFALSAWPQDYIIGPEDILEVAVHDNDDLNRRVAVSLEGSIGLPLIGKVKAAGLSARELELKITELLAQGYLKNPQVSVFIREYRSQKVFVLGTVRKAGAYPLTKATGLIEMISKAGGVSEEAGLDLVVIRPRDKRPGGPISPEEAKNEELTVVDLKALLDGDLSKNILLKDGDTIYVSHELDKKVYVLGQVNRPGKYPLGRNATVIDMVSKAQGATDEAGLELILVRPKANRETKGPLTPEAAAKDEITVLDLKALLEGDLRYNHPVQDEDTIFVPHRLTKRVYVVGALKRPGTFALGKNSSVIEMISKAEGLSEEAGDDAVVVRPLNRRKEGPVLPKEAKTGEIIAVDLKAIQQGDLAKNILLQDGDTVFVPKAEFFFVMGEVKKPGRYKIERDTTVLKAISTAGGLTEKAASKRTKVLREIGGVKQEVRVGLNDPVQAQDTIIVPESFF